MTTSILGKGEKAKGNEKGKNRQTVLPGLPVNLSASTGEQKET